MKYYKKKQQRNSCFNPFSATLLIVVGLFILLFSVDFASAITWDNIAYYNLDDTTGNAVDIVNGYDATVSGATQSATGKINTAYSFNGINGRVYTPNTGLNYNWTTLTAWVNIKNFTGANTIVSKKLGTGGGTCWRLNVEADGKVRALSSRTAGTIVIDSTNSIVENEWYFIAMVSNLTGIYVYINGTLEGSVANTNILSTGAYQNFTIGYEDPGAIIGNRYFTNGTIDEVGIWNRSLSSAEITDLYNYGNGLSYGGGVNINLISPSDNAIISDVGTNFTVNYTVSSDYNLTNATYYIWNSTGIFNDSVVVNITGTTNSTTEYIEGFSLGDYEWNVYTCYGNTTFNSCTFANSNYSFTFVPFSVINEEHNSPVLETSLQKFELNISTAEGYTIQNGRLVYNGTIYPYADMTDLGAGDYYLTKSIYIPGGVSGFENENRTFYWNLTIVNEETGISTNIETGEYGQNVTELKFGLCGGVLDVPMLNFTLYDEETGIQINSTANLTTFQATFNLGGSYLQLLKNYSINNLTVNKSEYDFCTDDENNTIYTNMELFYTAQGYTDKNYFLNNATLTNNTNEIPLYLLLEDNALEFFISVERSLAPLPYVTVNIEKYFVGEGVYKTIEIDETGVDGKFTAYLDLDKKYRFKIYEDGILLGSQEKTASCEAAPCTIELTISEDYETMMGGYFEAYASNVLYDLSYDGGTTIVTFDFIDTTGTANYFVMYIYKGSTNQSSQLIYNKTLYTSSGTMTYNMTEHGYTSGDFTVKVYVSRSPESFIDFLTIFMNEMAEELGLLGLFTSLILVLVIVFGFAFKPSLLIMSVPLTMTVMKLMGFISLSTIAITSIYILGGIAVASLSK